MKGGEGMSKKPSSRMNRFEKQRKNTKLLSIMIILASFLVVFLVLSFFIKNDDEAIPVSETTNQENNQDNNEQNSNAQNNGEKMEDDDKKAETTEELEGDKQIEGQSEQSPDPSDENVIEVIVNDWEPIGTVQIGEHVTSYDETTIDWKELMDAIHYATNLERDDMITWWIENGGSDDRVTATVTNKAQTKIYRVFLQFIDDEGWLPIKLELLKENDQKWRFEN